MAGIHGASLILAIYFIADPDTGDVKIGKTKNVDRRFKTFKTANPNIRLLGTIPGYTAEENELHRRFAKDRVAGEWFKLSPKLLKIAKEGRMDFDTMNDAFPPAAQMPGRAAPKNGKSEKQKIEERMKKEYEAKRKKTNQFVDRLFYGFLLVCIITLILNVNY